MPAIGVLGFIPKDFHDVENSSLDVIANPQDACDNAISVRQIAKASTLKTIAERRLSLADRTHHQSQDLTKFKPGLLVDLYRTPDRKEAPGWRGPAILLDIDDKVGTASLKWQGRSFDISLRMIREHVGVYATLLQLLHGRRLRRQPTPNARTINILYLSTSTQCQIDNFTRPLPPTRPRL